MRGRSADRPLSGRTIALGRLEEVLLVVLDVAAVEHGVLRRADVDEGRLHAREDVLDPAEVDVAVDLGHVVRRPADVVLDQVPSLEDRDLHQLGSHVDAHQVATDRPTVALPAPSPLQHLGVERDRTGRVALGLRAGRATGLAAPLLAVARWVSTQRIGVVGRRAGRGGGGSAGATPPASLGATRAALGRGGGVVAAAGAGRVSPIWGLRTSALSAATGSWIRPSMGRSGSSSGGTDPREAATSEGSAGVRPVVRRLVGVRAVIAPAAVVREVSVAGHHALGRGRAPAAAAAPRTSPAASGGGGR